MPEMTDDEIVHRAGEIIRRRSMMAETQAVRRAVASSGQPAYLSVTMSSSSSSVRLWAELTEEILQRLEDRYGE